MNSIHGATPACLTAGSPCLKATPSQFHGAAKTTARTDRHTVSTAASLTNAFTELKGLFEKQQADLTVHANFAASNPLLKQIQEGAPVDVFASTDQATMDKAVAAKVVDPATRRNFALNDLVLIVPKGGKKPVDLADLRNFKKIALGNPKSVPAGRYTMNPVTGVGAPW